MSMRRNSKIIAAILGMFLLASCTTAPLTGRRQLKLVSDESVARDSVAAYRQFINEAASKNLLANNTADGKRLKEIGGRISGAVEKYMNENGMSKKVNNLNWEFNLIKSEELNAFAMPGGKIAFFTGIMPVLKTDAGVAFVMGHEIGHVIGGHHAEGKSNQMTAGVVMIGKGVVDVLTGGATEIINNDLLGQGLQIGLLKFNRTQEYEADKYGMIFMAMAGYNPEEAIKVQERMAAKGSGSGVDFLSTHPSSDKRIQALKDFLPEAMKYYRKEKRFRK